MRVAIVWALLVLIWVGMGVFRAEVLAPRLPFDVWRAIESLAGGALGAVLVVAACRVLDRRTLMSIGFGFSRHDLKAFGIGAALWTTLAASGLLLGSIAQLFSVELGPPSWTMVGWLLLQLGLVFAYEAVPEELAIRGYVYTNLSEIMPPWLAVLTQAVLFMLWAFALVALLQAMGVGSDWSTDIDRAILFLSFGVSLALVRLWTGSLWGSIGYHLAFQVTMGLLSLDRLVIIRVDSSDLSSVGITLWAFGIVLGGLIALGGIALERLRSRTDLPRAGQVSS